ncbi:MAG: response regulator transcription factor [Chloroflexi bacterium]|nr:response regulator transcription factor [Chloroflexota bacterium]
MTPKARLLLVDDDEKLTNALEIFLSRAGYEVYLASNGLEGLKVLFRSRPDLVVVDVMMPYMDGWAMCQRIREMSTVPIILLTALGQEEDRVKGLRLGADDYIPKPFSLKEFEARVQAVLRRSDKTQYADKPRLFYTNEDLVIDSDRREVRRGGQRLELTATELHLLFFLAENAGRVLSLHQILEEVWGVDRIENEHYVKLFIWRLRQKIEPDPAEPRYILTERGLGYRMALPKV